MRKEVGYVTPDERDVIKSLFERRNGLIELARIVSTGDTALYDKLVKDMGETSTKFQNWWNETSKKYNWPSADNGNWEIDFDTCKIFLNVSQ